MLSISPQVPSRSDESSDRQKSNGMKPKPLSIQHRFVLLQAITFALAIWFLAGALYISLRIHHEMGEPLKNLHAALTLNHEIEATQEDLLQAAGDAYFHPGEATNEEFQAAARKLPGVAERYMRIQVSAEERRELETIKQLQARLIEHAGRHLGTERTTPETLQQFREVHQINNQIEFILRSIAQAHLQRLEIAAAKLHEYDKKLYLLLTGFGLFAVLILWQFRRVHRREIWGPLEQFRRMVMEIRRGNLNVTASIPRSIEFGALVQGFLDMARELREMRDSLEQKVQERTAKLEATQSELVQAAKLSSLGQLVSGVAHEINNPLTTILGFSELILSRPELEPRMRAQLQTIRSESVRLKNLVANLSSFARRAPQHTEQVDLRQLLDRLTDLRRYQLAASNIELHYGRPAGPVWVQGDRDHLVQVFFNLVLNAEQAFSAGRSKGDIWLACGIEDGRASATVRDNGPGMSPAVRERIFDPFFTTKPVGQGTGLGLSISHGIIEQHHGSITAESVEGQGTTIRISLPAAEVSTDQASAVAPALAGSAVANQHAAAPGLRALIIDDEPAITQLVQQFLENHGWHCVVLNDSTAAESCLAREHFDLVICDLKMPGRNGLEILRLLRQQRPELAQRFLLMTGNLADTEQKETAELAGVPILRKPFTLAGLAEALRALVPPRN